MISREKKFGHITGLLLTLIIIILRKWKHFFAIRYAKTYYFRDVVSFRWACCEFSILLISIKGQKKFLSWPQYKRLIPPGPSRLLGSVVYSLSVTVRLHGSESTYSQEKDASREKKMVNFLRFIQRSRAKKIWAW